MKIISIILLMIFIMETSVAAITPKEELKLILDELEFNLKVEWDQKDKAFAEEKMNQFNERLKVLYKKGLQKEDLLSTMQASINNEAFQKDLELLKLQMKFTNLSFEETRQILKENYQSSLLKGASWSDRTLESLPWILCGAIVLAVIAYAIVSGAKCNKDPVCSASSGSSDSSNSSDTWDNTDNTDYTDTVCEDEDVCDYYDDGTSYCYTTTYCY